MSIAPVTDEKAKLTTPVENTSPAVQPDAKKEEAGTAENAKLTEKKAVTDSLKKTDTLEAEPLLVQETKKPELDKKKWNFSLHGAIGYAQSAESLFPLIKSNGTDLIPNTTGFNNVRSDSSVEKGNHFAFGIGLHRAITARLQFSTGLQYNYGTTRQNVGDKVMDSVLTSGADRNYFYKSGSSNRYTNKYHFIELPVGIDLQLLRDLPLELHAGFSVTRLIGSNALHYNESSDAYYVNNDRLRKTGISWFTGLSYGLIENKLKFGPHIQYSFFPLQRESDNKKTYLLTAGLKASWMLH
jgi:hypothetical protein